MKPSIQKVLNKLRSNKRKGITGEDFPKMTSYSKRLSELRYMGYHIHDEYETLPTGCRRKRYWLIKEAKCQSV